MNNIYIATKQMNNIYIATKQMNNIYIATKHSAVDMENIRQYTEAKI